MSLKLKYNISKWAEHGLNYWGIPKCGNTSAKAKLMNVAIFDTKDSNSWVHMDTYAVYITKEEAMRNGLKNVTIVRNPYDRVVSMFNDFCVRRTLLIPEVRGMNINTFIKYLCNAPDDISTNVHFRSQFYFISHNGHIIPKLYKLEKTYNDELAEKFFPDKKVNYSDTPFKLEKSQKEKIYSRYIEDFELLGYEK